MIAFDIAQLVPQFLRNDKNGYAMAKAIEAGLKTFLSAAKDGLNRLTDIDNAEEWRLDELAWEYGCLYDYHADIEAKRIWIREATSLFSAYGTPQALYNFLNGLFDHVEIEEFWQYGGEPFHFRVAVSGAWTGENEAWIRQAIAAAQNARSVFDDIAVCSRTGIVVHGECTIAAKSISPLAEEEFYAGTYPE